MLPVPALLLLDAGPLDLLLFIAGATGIAGAVGFGLFLWRIGKLGQGVQVVAALLLLVFIYSLGDGLWADWQRQQARQHSLVLREQHRVAAFTTLTGQYVLVDTMLLKTNYDPFIDTLQPLPVHVQLVLRPDSIYSYHSSIPHDATLDTAGTWKLDEHIYYEKYVAAFTPARRPALGLQLVREDNGQVSAQGAYYRHHVYTPFRLLPQQTPR